MFDEIIIRRQGLAATPFTISPMFSTVHSSLILNTCWKKFDLKIKYLPNMFT